MRRLVLASASPARLATLRAAGLDPEVVVSGVDESGVDGGSAAATALTLAQLKARAVAAGQPPGTFVLGCDSVLELDGETRGKPRDAGDAASQWRRMRGRSGTLHTGHCLIETGTAAEQATEAVDTGVHGRVVSEVASTLVVFADVTDAEIDAYLATGEPLAVAGAFTVDGLGGVFVESIEGDFHNVVGVSLPLLRHMLADLGVQVTSLWRHAGVGVPPHPQ